jgi:hypothetical protein
MNAGDMSVNTNHASFPYYFGEVAYTRANDVAETWVE